MISTCSPHKIEGLLEAIKSNEAGSQEKVRSWSTATMAALSRLMSDYNDYPDMVQPLVMALLQVSSRLISDMVLLSTKNVIRIIIHCLLGSGWIKYDS